MDNTEEPTEVVEKSKVKRIMSKKQQEASLVNLQKAHEQRKIRKEQLVKESMRVLDILDEDDAKKKEEVVEKTKQKPKPKIIKKNYS